MSLLDREQDIAVLSRAYAGATAGRGQVVLVAGEAGIGKTSLLRAFLASISPAEAHALVTRGWDHETTPPYEPWLQLLAEEPELRSRLAVPLGTREPPAQSVFDLARQTAAALHELARERPVVLVVDDLHLSDESSLVLLRAVAQRAAQSPMLLVGSLRTPVEPASALAAFISFVMREASAHYLDLPPIGAEAIRRFVEERYADLPPAEREHLGQELARLSGGNGLFLSHLLEAVDAPDPGGARSPGERLQSLPVTLREIIEYQAARLSPTTLETLRLAALIGETIDLDLLSEVCGRAHDDVLRDLEAALRRGLLYEERTGDLHFRHETIRLALIEGQPAIRRKRHHATILAALRRRPNTPPGDLALHAERAGDLVTAFEAFAEAGHRAVRIFALPEAVSFFQRAVALADGAHLDPVREDEIRLALADGLLRSDRDASAREVDRVASRAIVRDDRLTLARARQRQALLLYESGRRSEAKALLEQAIPHLERAGDRKTLAEALSCLGYCFSSESEFRAVERIARRLLFLADELNDSAHRAVASYLTAIALVARGEPAEAPRLMRESIAILSELGRLDIATGFATVAFMRVDLLANLHRPQMVEDLIRWGEELDAESDRRLGVPPGQCTIEFSYWRFLRGEWERARQDLPPPSSVRTGAYPQVHKDIVHTIAAEFAIAEGRLDDAEGLLAYIAPAPSAPLGEHSYQQWLMAVERLILLRVQRGALDRAREWIRALDRALEEKPHVPGELLLDLSAARLSLAAGDPERAVHTLAEVIHRAERTHNMLVVIAALRLQAAALRQCENAAEAIEAATRAVIEADRCQLVYDAALSRLARAEAGIRVAGREAAAREDLAQATAVFERLGARAALERARRLAGRSRRSRRAWPAGLTDREVAVLRLLAEGYSDRQIAEALYISARTVGTHVANMFAKTGTNNRVALAAWALTHGVAGGDDTQ